MTDNLEKLTKTDLLQKLEEKENEIRLLEDEIENLKQELDKLKIKYEIIETARKEDEKKIKSAERIIEESEKKNHEIIQVYQVQIERLTHQLNEQNQTLISLFEMLDQTINTQVIYYKHYKKVFLQDKNMKEE